MSGNQFGKLFSVSSFGESHGPAIGGIVDGCPPGISLTESDLQKDLDRRRPGTSSHVTQRQEKDQVHILSGVFEGVTTGTPIGLLIHNTDAKSKDYTSIAKQFRPGHADFTYQKKYGIRDYRGGGRSSARETAIRVAAGAIAKKYLFEQCGVEIQACVTAIGAITADEINWNECSNNSFFWPCAKQIPELENFMASLRKELDSVGARVQIRASGVPVGLGEPVFDRLDADIAKGLMSINASKGVEIGDGFSCVAAKGSEFRDTITKQGFASNHAGGILGGISSGQTITASVAFKPTSSIPQKTTTLTESGDEEEIKITGRHDPCVGIRAVAICEAMVALTICDHYLRNRAQCGH